MGKKTRKFNYKYTRKHTKECCSVSVSVSVIPELSTSLISHKETKIPNKICLIYSFGFVNTFCERFCEHFSLFVCISKLVCNHTFIWFFISLSNSKSYEYNETTLIFRSEFTTDMSIAAHTLSSMAKVCLCRSWSYMQYFLQLYSDLGAHYNLWNTKLSEITVDNCSKGRVTIM